MSANQAPSDDELKSRFRSFSQELTVDVGSITTIERRARSKRARRRLAAGLGVTAFMVMVSMTAFLLVGERSTTRQDTPIAEVAAMYQRNVGLEVVPLGEQGTYRDLEDVLAASAVAGRGHIVDARLGYSLEHGVFEDGTRDLERRLLLVIEPVELVKRTDQLGTSGLVYVSLPWSDAYDLDAFRTAATSTSDQVVFFLTPVVFESWQTIVDEFAGREKDDPVYWPTNPLTLLGVDSSASVAMPLLSGGEGIEPTPTNLAVLDSLGAAVNNFTTAPLEIESVPDPNPDDLEEEDVPSTVDSQ